MKELQQKLEQEAAAFLSDLDASFRLVKCRYDVFREGVVLHLAAQTLDGTWTVARIKDNEYYANSRRHLGRHTPYGRGKTPGEALRTAREHVAEIFVYAKEALETDAKALGLDPGE